MAETPEPSRSAPRRADGKAPTLLDVAALAGVSRATAARALNGSPLVTEETRQSIEAAAAALNYRTNELARAMRAGRSKTIGLVIADISNSFFDRATRSIIDTAASAGYQVLVINTDDDLEAEVRAVRVLMEKRVDGLIVVPSSPDQSAHLLIAGEPIAPLVLLDRRLTSIDAGTIATDDHTSAREAVELFAKRGHSKVGLLISAANKYEVTADGAPGVVSTIVDRVTGFIAGLEEFGLEVNWDWIRYSRAEHGAATEVASAMLSSESRPTAILTTNSDMALAVIDACHHKDLSIGGDVSLISFDDAPWAQVFVPAISVVERPVYELGKAAVTALLDQIDGGLRHATSVELKNRLIDRQSIAGLGRPLSRAMKWPPR